MRAMRGEKGSRRARDVGSEQGPIPALIGCRFLIIPRNLVTAGGEGRKGGEFCGVRVCGTCVHPIVRVLPP
jgi:hypothetical protein